ncbi:MAG: hypothetical protein NHG13_00895 [Candidatus Shikimatogenerans bostrichidophilus]|nr:MAG: hypothetical protein NHG13_00895 [Candidatus Shikimatogenerans bostrichidophilus]
MLKLSYILNNKKKIIKSLKKRQFNNLKLIDEIIYLYKKFKLIKKKKDKLLNKINKFSKNFFKKGINKNILLIKNKKKKK